jgi:hypothetical protein
MGVHLRLGQVLAAHGRAKMMEGEVPEFAVAVAEAAGPACKPEAAGVLACAPEPEPGAAETEAEAVPDCALEPMAEGWQREAAGAPSSHGSAPCATRTLFAPWLRRPCRKERSTSRRTMRRLV